MVQYRNRKYQGRESIRPPCDKSISHNIIAEMLLAHLPQIMDGSVGMSGQVTLPNGAIYLGEAHYFDVWIEDLQQAKVNLEYEQSEIAKEQSRIAEL